MCFFNYFLIKLLYTKSINRCILCLIPTYVYKEVSFHQYLFFTITFTYETNTKTYIRLSNKSLKTIS